MRLWYSSHMCVVILYTGTCSFPSGASDLICGPSLSLHPIHAQLSSGSRDLNFGLGQSLFHTVNLV